MFSKSTVVILGAGASHECDLPLGSVLRDEVAKALRFRFDHTLSSGDARLYELIQNQYGHKARQIIAAGNALASTAPNFPSIDEALHYFGDQPEVIEIGKIAIVNIIAAAENKSKLATDRATGNPDLTKLRGTWYDVLFSLAISGIQKANAAKMFDKVCFINFNYDRTLECFLFHALAASADVGVDVADDIATRLRIIRPYGSLGAFTRHLSFRDTKPGELELVEMAKKIRTFTEAHQENLETQISQALDQSELVIVLGFGFHNQNMALFKPTNQVTRRRDRIVFATARGVHPENQQMIRSALEQCFIPRAIKLMGMTAHELLSELRPSIVAAAT